jgi:hypothetical protein
MKRSNVSMIGTLIIVLVFICGSIAHIIPQCNSLRDVINLMFNWLCVSICIDVVKIVILIFKEAIELERKGKKNDNN